MSTDIDALPNEHDLVEGDHAMVGVADLNGQAHLFVSVTAKVPDAHLLDGWILPASSDLLRGIARDLAAGADALDEL